MAVDSRFWDPLDAQHRWVRATTGRKQADASLTRWLSTGVPKLISSTYEPAPATIIEVPEGNADPDDSFPQSVLAVPEVNRPVEIQQTPSRRTATRLRCENACGGTVDGKPIPRNGSLLPEGVLYRSPLPFIYTDDRGIEQWPVG